MRIDIITLFPEQLEAVLSSSILGRAQTSGHLQLHLHNLRDYSEDKWGRVDDYPYGGDAGMVLRIEPVAKAIESLQGERAYDEVIFAHPMQKCSLKREPINSVFIKTYSSFVDITRE